MSAESLPLSCRASYNTALRQALGSKLFFVDKLPMQDLGVVVDFGCADGSLLKALSGMVSKDCALLGIDQDLGQLKAARLTFPQAEGFFSSWDFGDPYLDKRPSLLILSSVIHEVLSKQDLTAFWAEVEARGFDYIVVRDMAVPRAYRHRQTPKLWQGLIRASQWSHLLADHELAYGTIEWLDSCVHFLLKYPYAHDWARENAEDYMPHSSEGLVERMTSGSFAATHHAATVTKHFYDRVRSDLGFAPSGITTHAEIILTHERVRGSVRSELDAGGNLRVA